MKLIQLTFCVPILFFACSSPDKVETPETPVYTIPEEKVTSNITTHLFSDSIQLDTFKLQLVSGTALDGKMLFEVVDHSGGVIYSESFETNYLLGYGIQNYFHIVDTVRPTPEMMDEYIHHRIAHFFDEENFIQPAIGSDKVFDPKFANSPIISELLDRPNAIGFAYLIGKEDARKIAYSRKQKKAVVYFNMD